MTPKPRNHRNDGLASSVREWEQMPVELEQAYRRGFQHGLVEALEAMGSNATAQDIERFIYGPVHRWRWQDPIRWGAAPRFNTQPDSCNHA